MIKKIFTKGIFFCLCWQSYVMILMWSVRRLACKEDRYFVCCVFVLVVESCLKSYLLNDC